MRFFSFAFRATTNKKLRETVALELSFVNSNLQLLKEQLAELNSSVEVYQKDRWGNQFFFYFWLKSMHAIAANCYFAIALIDPGCKIVDPHQQTSVEAGAFYIQYFAPHQNLAHGRCLHFQYCHLKRIFKDTFWSSE
jgi:Hr1 repeat